MCASEIESQMEQRDVDADVFEQVWWKGLGREWDTMRTGWVGNAEGRKVRRGSRETGRKEGSRGRPLDRSGVHGRMDWELIKEEKGESI